MTTPDIGLKIACGVTIAAAVFGVTLSKGLLAGAKKVEVVEKKSPVSSVKNVALKVAKWALVVLALVAASSEFAVFLAGGLAGLALCGASIVSGQFGMGLITGYIGYTSLDQLPRALNAIREVAHTTLLFHDAKPCRA